MGEGSTTRIDAEACRCWTRVMRQSTVLFRAGSVFSLRGWDDDLDENRGMVRVGLPVLLEAGTVETEPMIEAQIFDSYTWVPEPARCVVVEPTTSPGRTLAMFGVLAVVNGCQ